MKTVVFSTLVVLGLSTAAFAQEAAPPAGAVAAPDFASVDADASGGLSMEEIQAVFVGVTADQFAAVDSDGNGELSADEFAVATTPPADPAAAPAPATPAVPAVPAVPDAPAGDVVP